LRLLAASGCSSHEPGQRAPNDRAKGDALGRSFRLSGVADLALNEHRQTHAVLDLSGSAGSRSLPASRRHGRSFYQADSLINFYSSCETGFRAG
jgi:hypothetical protein